MKVVLYWDFDELDNMLTTKWVILYKINDVEKNIWYITDIYLNPELFILYEVMIKILLDIIGI